MPKNTQSVGRGDGDLLQQEMSGGDEGDILFLLAVLLNSEKTLVPLSFRC